MSLSLECEPDELRELLERINRIPRTGWLNSRVPVKECETVGQHTARMLAIVHEHAASWVKIDTERVLSMVRCHDFAEVITGDRTPGEITPEQKRLEEDDAYDQFCKLEPARGRVIRERCIEYREDKTPEAQLAKDVDKFQRLEQADKYRKEFPELDFRRFQLDADLVRDPELKRKANEIVKAWRKSDLQDMKFIFVIGPPCVGKGTQCAKVVHLYKRMAHVSAGELLRSAKKDDKSRYHKDATNVLKGITPASPELITALIYDAVTSADYNSVLIDGFPYDSAQLTGYKNIFPNASGVVNFKASADVCKERLRSRATASARDDDAESKIDKRREDYEGRGQAIARQLQEENDGTYHEINAEQDEDAVTLQFQKVLDNILDETRMNRDSSKN